jgi:hypothetical protein
VVRGREGGRGLYINCYDVNRQTWDGVIRTENVASDRDGGGAERRHDWTRKKNITRNTNR